MVGREKRLNVRVSDEEMEMLKALAEAEGLRQSDVLRLFIRRAYVDRFGSEPSPKKRKR